MQDYRPVGAFSFLGRYRVIDFPISNMSNSGIDHIQVYIRRKPQSLTAHLGTGRHYNINSKSGNLQILYSGLGMNMSLYNNDIASYIENLEYIEQQLEEYVVIAPSYMIYTQDYNKLLNTHIESGADITLLYHSVDNAKEYFLNCYAVNLNKQKGVLSLEQNHGNTKNKNIFDEIDEYMKEQPDKPLLLVEYCHAMGNGPGDLEDYFELIQKYDSLCGGFVWEWCDHAIDKGTAENGKRIYYYGGDHGEEIHVTNFSSSSANLRSHG